MPGSAQADQNTKERGNQPHSFIGANESGLLIPANPAGPSDLGTSRQEDVPHPIGGRAIQQREDQAIPGAERPHWRRIRSPGHAAAVADDRERRQPARNQPHERVRDLAIEPSKDPGDRHTWTLRRVQKPRPHAVGWIRPAGRQTTVLPTRIPHERVSVRRLGQCFLAPARRHGSNRGRFPPLLCAAAMARSSSWL